LLEVLKEHIKHLAGGRQDIDYIDESILVSLIGILSHEVSDAKIKENFLSTDFTKRGGV